MKKTSKQALNVQLPPSFVSSEFISDLIDVTADDSFASRYLASELMSKYCDESLTPAVVRRDAAISKWKDAEERNATTNSRLLFLYDADFGWVTGSQLLSTIRRFVADALGPLVYPDVLTDFTVTNGASVDIKRSSIAPHQKLSQGISSLCI